MKHYNNTQPKFNNALRISLCLFPYTHAHLHTPCLVTSCFPSSLPVSLLLMRHYFDSRCSNRSGEDFYFWEQIQTVIKPCFCPQLCQFLMKIIPVINWVCTCIKTSIEDDNFLREGWGWVNLMIFIWEFLRFGLTEKALFQVIWGLLGISIRPNDFYLRVFMFWFDRKSIIPGNLGFAR